MSASLSSRQRAYRGMSIAEILISMVILSMVTLAIVLVMARGMDLNRRDAEIAASTMYCTQAMEQAIYSASTVPGFEILLTAGNLGSTQLDPTHLYFYRQSVTQFSQDMAKITVCVYAQDPRAPLYAPDLLRARNGQLVQMSSVVVKPGAE